MHDEGFTLGRRQPLERSAEVRAKPLLLNPVAGAISRVDKRPRLLERNVPPTGPSQVIKASVPQGPEQPTAETRAIAAVSKLRERAHERVLDHVGGDVVVEDH
jgi:hypothetical protein